MHPHDAEARGIEHGDWVGVTSRAGDTVLRVEITDRVAPGVVYTTFHFPESGANLITTENSDWATNCPEYKVTAVQVVKVAQPASWQRRRQAAVPAKPRRACAAREELHARIGEIEPWTSSGWSRWPTTSPHSSMPKPTRPRRPKACAFTCRASGRRACGARSSRTCEGRRRAHGHGARWRATG